MLGVVASLAVAGCGGSGNSREDKQFVNTVNANCFARLSHVNEAADTTKTNAPRDNVLAQAQQELLSSKQELLGTAAPADKRQAQTEVSTLLGTSAIAIARYLHDKQVNEPATSDDWNRIIQQLSELDQVASGHGLRGCALPIQ